MHKCTAAEIGAQLNLLCLSLKSALKSHTNVQILVDLSGPAHIHCPQVLLNRKQMTEQLCSAYAP